MENPVVYTQMTAAILNRLIFKCHVCNGHTNVNGSALRNHYLHHGYPDIRRPRIGYDVVRTLPIAVERAVQGIDCYGCPYCFAYIPMRVFNQQVFQQHIGRHVDEAGGLQGQGDDDDGRAGGDDGGLAGGHDENRGNGRHQQAQQLRWQRLQAREQAEEAQRRGRDEPVEEDANEEEEEPAPAVGARGRGRGRGQGRGHAEDVEQPRRVRATLPRTFRHIGVRDIAGDGAHLNQLLEMMVADIRGILSLVGLDNVAMNGFLERMLRRIHGNLNVQEVFADWHQVITDIRNLQPLGNAFMLDTYTSRIENVLERLRWLREE